MPASAGSTPSSLTHGDPDHIGGAGAILREFRPREVWEGIPVPRFEPLRGAARRRAGSSGCGGRTSSDRRPRRTSTASMSSSQHPDPADWERQKVRNDDSIVLDLRWRDVSVVLTGDIGKAVERRRAGALPPSPLRVVKVPHHGSLTSSTTEFVRALRPQVAVVSAGRANHFGHPVPEVLERYRDAGAEIFRTDQDGAVTVDTDGYSLDVHTFTGRQAQLDTHQLQSRRHEEHEAMSSLRRQSHAAGRTGDACATTYRLLHHGSSGARTRVCWRAVYASVHRDRA